MFDKTSYPQNRNEWSKAIERGLGITQAQGEERYLQSNFPIQELAEWLKKEYSAGFGPNFIQALLRNINGLIAWIYGNKLEPYWPGSDKDPQKE
jgi:hypothetical protein